MVEGGTSVSESMESAAGCCTVVATVVKASEAMGSPLLRSNPAAEACNLNEPLPVPFSAKFQVKVALPCAGMSAGGSVSGRAAASALTCSTVTGGSGCGATPWAVASPSFCTVSVAVKLCRG